MLYATQPLINLRAVRIAHNDERQLTNCYKLKNSHQKQKKMYMYTCMFE